MSEKLVTYSVQEDIAHIGLNDQPRLNALSKSLVEHLNSALDAAENDVNVSVIVIYGQGRAFCVGGDLKEFIGVKSKPESDFVKAWERIEECKLPVIAAVHGYAVGGGCELMLMTDYVIATKTAWFSQPELKLGFIPGCGATQRLPRRIGYGSAFDLMASGKQISAEMAYSIGLVDKVIEDDTLLLSSAHECALIWGKQGRSELIQLKIAMKSDYRRERQIFYEMAAGERAQQGIQQFLNRK
jgi:enoyl-CoA hydratase